MSHLSLQNPAQRCYQITRKDLPLCCPTPGMQLWDGHPRVYLPIAQTGYQRCPYCDAEYTLVDDENSGIK